MTVYSSSCSKVYSDKVLLMICNVMIENYLKIETVN